MSYFYILDNIDVLFLYSPYILTYSFNNVLYVLFTSGCVTLISSAASCIALSGFFLFFSTLDYISSSVCFNKFLSDGL